MTTLEQLLRDAMTDRAATVTATRSHALARRALRHRSRARRLQAGAVAGTAAAAAVAVAGPALLAPSHRSTTGEPGAGGAAPVATTSTFVATGTTPLPAVTNAPTPLEKGKYGHGPADLDAVTLLDPAPGFPLRRMPDEAAGLTGGFDRSGKDFWSKDFLLGVTEPLVTSEGDGGSSSTPTGPEATVEVVDGSPAVEYHLTGHTTVGGRAATVHQLVDKDVTQTIVVFTAGRFQVRVVGGSSAVSIDQLVALGEALRGLPD